MSSGSCCPMPTCWPGGEPAHSPSPAATSKRSGCAPVEVELDIAVPGRQVYLEITEVATDRLVTAIELVSPSNKRPGHRDRIRYLRKRDSYLASEVHFIEIDLLRGGERWAAGRGPDGAYRILLSHADRRPRAQVWSIGLREPLPTVPVPLLPEDPDVDLPVQAALDAAYDGGGYRRFVRHDGPVPAPPLTEEDLSWVRKCLGRTPPAASRRSEPGASR